jgi:hypothetical protein
MLAVVDEDELDDVPRVLHALTVALVQVQRRGRPAFAEARDRGLEAVKEFAPKTDDADLQLSYQRWARRLAKDAGGLAAWIWARLRAGQLPRAGSTP